MFPCAFLLLVNADRYLTTVCFIYAVVIEINFNMLRRADYFSLTVTAGGGTQKYALITTHYVAPRRSHREKAACQWAWTKRKGPGLWNHNLGCASIRKQFRKIPVEERGRSGACRHWAANQRFICAQFSRQVSVRGASRRSATRRFAHRGYKRH